MKTAAFYITLIVSVGLIVGGFFVPPMGVIDGSVLQAVGLLLAFGVIGQLPTIIATAKTTKVQAGNVNIEIEGKTE